MNNNDNELTRGLQARREDVRDTRSNVSSSPSPSSVPVLARTQHLEQQQQQQQQQRQDMDQQQQLPPPVQRQSRSQSDQKEQSQLQSVRRPYQSQCIQPQIGHSIQPTQQEDKEKKNKCRGNRQLQRYRAKLRKQGLDNETITRLINDYTTTTTNQGQNNERSTLSDMDMELLMPEHNQDILENENNVQQIKSTKRKRDTRQTTTAAISTSMSQMSISNLPTKKRQHIKKQTNIDQSISDHKPKYLKVPDQVFKQMLSKALTGAESVVQLLDTHEKIQFVRTYAHLLNNVFYWKLEQDYWEHYNNVCMTESIWSSSLSKDIAKENNLCRFKFKTKTQLDKHRQLIVNRLQETENKLSQHKQEPINSSIDMNRLSTIIPAFVRQGQYKLSKEFERKKLIVQFDANDYRLLKRFYDMKPTEDQVRSSKIIWQATKDKLQAEEQVAVLKQRIYTKRLPSSFNILDHSIDNIEQMLKQPGLNQDKRATLSFRRLKTIAQFKYDLMVLAITTAEETVRTHEKIIVDEKQKLVDNVTHGQAPLPRAFVQLMNTIAARQTNLVQRSQIILKQKLSVFDDAPMAIDMAELACHLSSKQFSYLTYGPKYVPPCQSHFSGQTIDKIIQQEYETIIQCFTNGFNDNYVSVSDQRAIDFFADVKNLLHRLYTTPLPRKLQNRIQYEQYMIRRIQHQLKRFNCSIRPTDKSKVFHLGSAEDYHRKALEYMQKTNAYQEIPNGINPCMDHLRAVLSLIDPLLQNKTIDLKIWQQSMRPNVKTIELAHLYFIPKPHKIGTPLRPIVSSIHAAATGVSHFLDEVLRPFYNQIAKSSTFINDIDFVRQLEQYRDNGYLLPTTLFITFDVTDLYTMIPRDGIIDALGRFLVKHCKDGKINGMIIDTIMKMTRLVIDTNCFVFENKYYQQIRGGAMGSPLTMTLANIYMFEWEQSLIEHQKLHNEIYGRFIDDVFITTNSLNQMNILFNQMEKKDENIRITRSIGTTIEFLDVLVTNDYGQLKTSVYHKPAAEPYILPYLSDHPRHIHSNTIKGALYRAVRLCSNVHDFDTERLHIELTLLLNGYPPKFVTYHFKRFFQQHNAMSMFEFELNDTKYQELHKKLLAQPSQRERDSHNKMLVSKENNTSKEQKQQQQPKSKSEVKIWDKSIITVKSTFESGPILQFKRELRRLWKKYYIYQGSSLNNVRLQIGTRSNRSLSQLFVKKKPPKKMLVNMESVHITTT